jgi:peptidoglycan/LPS O-acetylase OafA/YrhL
LLASIGKDAAVGQPNQESDNPSQWAVLALLRFILASIVVACHLGLFCWNASWVVFLRSFGPKTAVLCFFVISGYSIAASIQRRPEGFFKRRFWRIYPLYVVGLAIAYIASELSPGHYRTIAQGMLNFEEQPWLGALFLLQGWICHTPLYNAALWSLSAEIALYACAPLLRKGGPILMGVVIVASAVFYLAHSSITKDDFIGMLHGGAFACFAWAWVGGFLFYSYRRSALAKALFIVPGWILVMVENPDPFWKFAPYADLIVVAVISMSVHARLGRSVIKCFNYAGEISYPLYIVHYPCLLIMLNFFNITSAAVMAPIALLVSMACYHAIDAPIRLKRRRAAALREAQAAPAPAPSQV